MLLKMDVIIETICSTFKVNAENRRRRERLLYTSLDVSADKNALTRQSHQLQTSWELSTWGQGVWYTFEVSRSNKPEVEYGGHSAYKMQNSTENVAKSPTFCTLTRNRGWQIEQRCLSLHRKLISNRLCACVVQMLLKMAVIETI